MCTRLLQLRPRRGAQRRCAQGIWKEGFAPSVTGPVNEVLDRLVPAIERPRDIKDHVTKIRPLEREGDEIYREATASLFNGGLPVPTVIMLKEIYDNLENTIDRCQHVGDLVERIAIKNM